MARRKSRKSSRRSYRRTARRTYRRTYRKARRTGRPKKPSLSGILILAGAGAAVSGLAADKAAKVMDASAPLLATVGITTGAGLVGAAIAARAACSAFPSFGAKYRGFLAGYGFRP